MFAVKPATDTSSHNVWPRSVIFYSLGLMAAIVLVIVILIFAIIAVKRKNDRPMEITVTASANRSLDSNG